MYKRQLISISLFLALHIPAEIMGCKHAPLGYLECQFRGENVSEWMTAYSILMSFLALVAILVFCIALIFLLCKFAKKKIQSLACLNDT